MGLKNVASPAVRGGKNVLLDIFGPRAEMFHASPVSGLNKLQPFVAPAAGTAYGAPKPYVYLAQGGDDVANKLAGYLDTAGSMGFDAAGNKIDNITKTGSIYKTKVPLHRLESYGGPASSSFRRTPKSVKVASELKANQMPRKDFLAALQKFVG